METKRSFLTFITLVYLLAIFALNWQEDRTEFLFILTSYAIAFASYLGLLKHLSHFRFKHLVFIALLAQLLSLWNEPNLSIDYFRFIWDGEITLAGINPFDYTPNEVIEQQLIENTPHISEIFDGISDLSKRNYSCYPPVNQFYFILASAVSNNLWLNVIVLKVLIVITQIIGFRYLIKTFELVGINQNRAWLLYLNPLWIIECTGNTHFEGVMISFLFIALYFLLQKKEKFGGLFFAIAIQIKLIPLMLLPFFYRFLGIWKSILFYAIALGLVIAFGLIQLNTSNIAHFIQSLKLYFQVFEFNSFILHYYIQFGIMETGWNMMKTYGPQLSRIAMMIILTLALYGPMNNWKKLFNRMTIAFFVYLLLSSTIHPWYILSMIALSLFTNYSFPILWSFLIFFSYVFYSYEDLNHSTVRLLTNIEYISVIGLFLFELIKKKSPFNFLHLGYITPSAENQSFSGTGS